MAEDETTQTSNSTSEEVDYWADLPEKCKTSKKARFNHIMNEIHNK